MTVSEVVAEVIVIGIVIGTVIGIVGIIVTEIIAIPEIIAVPEMIIINATTVVSGVDLGIHTGKGVIQVEVEGDITQVAIEETMKRHGVKVADLQQEEHERRLLQLGTILPCRRMSSAPAEEVKVKIPRVVMVSAVFIFLILA